MRVVSHVTQKSIILSVNIMMNTASYVVRYIAMKVLIATNFQHRVLGIRCWQVLCYKNMVVKS